MDRGACVRNQRKHSIVTLKSGLERCGIWRRVKRNQCGAFAHRISVLHGRKHSRLQQRVGRFRAWSGRAYLLRRQRRRCKCYATILSICEPGTNHCSTGLQQKMAQQLLTQFQDHEDAWQRVDSILDRSTVPQTKVRVPYSEVKKARPGTSMI